MEHSSIVPPQFLNHGSTAAQSSPQNTNPRQPPVAHLGDHSKPRNRRKDSNSKIGDELLRPKMNPATPTTPGVRGLSSSTPRDKGNDDDGLLRPITRETTRPRWGSESTALDTGSSLFDVVDKRPHLIKSHEVRSMEDLQHVKDQRSQGEEYLRSALSLIGTLATDITRRLDYTYYGLLEKIAALNTTIISFQELSDSTSKLYSDFERETSGLEQDIRKQINDIKGFKPQLRRIEVLEKRMRMGKARAGALSSRLEAMSDEIERWERKEEESQKRINQQLRIVWGMVAAGIGAFMIALALQNWPSLWNASPAVLLKTAQLPNPPASVFPSGSDRVFVPENQGDRHKWPPSSPDPGARHISDQTSTSTYKSVSTGGDITEKSPDNDPFKIFDEL